MAQKMKCVRKVRPEVGLVVQELAVPAVGPTDVLVQVEAASLCGTDLHIWKWDEWASQRIKPPLTLGHEFAGTVVEVGSEVHHVKVGDYVSAESHVTCGMCYQCRTGQAHMCPKTSILGVDRDGAFAEYVAVPEKVIWQNDRSKLPPEIATLQEPFGNAVFTVFAQPVTGQTMGVFGCGPIGCFSIGIAKACGAAAVYATDVIDYRLELATRMGADAVFNARGSGGKVSSVDRVVEWMVKANKASGVDISLEMSGAPEAITAAFRAVRNGGHVTLFGIPARPVEIDVAENMIFKNLTVLGLNGRRIFDTWYRTQWLLESGAVDLRPLVTHDMPLERIDHAVHLLLEGQGCKIVLRPGAAKASPAPPRQAADAETEPANIRGEVIHR